MERNQRLINGSDWRFEGFRQKSITAKNSEKITRVDCYLYLSRTYNMDDLIHPYAREPNRQEKVLVKIKFGNELSTYQIRLA